VTELPYTLETLVKAPHKVIIAKEELYSDTVGTNPTKQVSKEITIINKSEANLSEKERVKGND